MAYRVSFPVENAQKLLGYLESGQLQFCVGDFDVHLDSAGKPIVTMDREVFRYDSLIKATGSPREVENLDSDLIGRLLERGIMTPNRLGGINIDAKSHQLVGANGRLQSRLRAVGELTSGTFFFTSALDINARHARLCATHFAETIKDHHANCQR